MKRIPLFIIATSLAFNGYLLVGLLHATSDTPAPAHPASPAQITAPTIDAAGWAKLDLAELPQLIARLRAAGFPNDVIRGIVISQVSERFDAKRRALQPVDYARPYWKMESDHEDNDVALRQLDREQEKTILDLLGATRITAEIGEPMELFFRLRQFGHLSGDKIAAIQRIQADFWLRSSEISAGDFAPSSPEDRNKLEVLSREEHRAITSVLTPAELEAYDLRNSTSANKLRAKFQSMDLSESEFLALYRLRQSIDEQFPPIGRIVDAEREGQRTAEESYEAQVKALLGDQRYQMYQMTSTRDYQHTAQLVSRLQLPPETTATVYAVQQSIQPKIEAVNENHALSASERAMQLAALATEANTKIAEALGGARALDAYKLNNGDWLQELERTAARLKNSAGSSH